jgi:hypothetical protein
MTQKGRDTLLRLMFLVIRFALFIAIFVAVLPSTRTQVVEVIHVVTAPRVDMAQEALDPDRSSSYEFLRVNEGGDPYRWWPCNTITWRHNVAEDSILEAVRSAVESASLVTGLRFVEQGPTEVAPIWGESVQIEGTSIVIVSVPRSTLDEGAQQSFDGRRLGGAKVTTVDFGGEPLISTATIFLADDIGEPQMAQTIAMHELGHALGLGHTDDHTQIMAPSQRSSRPPRWGAGDIAGLERVARLPIAGCGADGS